MATIRGCPVEASVRLLAAATTWSQRAALGHRTRAPGMMASSGLQGRHRKHSLAATWQQAYETAKASWVCKSRGSGWHQRSVRFKNLPLQSSEIKHNHHVPAIPWAHKTAHVLLLLMGHVCIRESQQGLMALLPAVTGLKCRASWSSCCPSFVRSSEAMSGAR